MPLTTIRMIDIETRADTDLLARLPIEPKNGFLPLLYHLPCAVAVGHVTSEGVLTVVESLGSGLFDDPCELTELFWELLNRTPFLVTFNGRAFDVPVMELCALRYGACASRHWGEKYGSRYRYGQAHIDLLDVLCNYGGATRGYKLGHLVALLGYAGQDGMDGSMVQGLWEVGKIDEIQAYNRNDCIRTFALWLQWSRISGRLTETLYQESLKASAPFLDLIR
jgi:3'-5' exonuclease